MATSYNISIEQGSTFSGVFTARDESGNAINLAGYTSSGQIRNSYGSTGILQSLTTSIDASLISGLISVSLTATQTASLPVTKSVYDVEIYGNGGYTLKVIKGYVEISPEVTR